MASARINESLVNRHLAAENRHEMEATLATLHPECTFEDMALDETFRGRAGAGRYYRLWWDAFDLTVEGQRRFWADDGTMISEARYVGRHVGNFYGVPATDRAIELALAVIIGFRDGLMAGERFYYDVRTLMAQLGVSHLPGICS